MNTVKENVGLPDIFRSKRFWTAIVGIISMGLVALEPRLYESAPMIEASILAITSLLITSFTGQDWLVAKAQGESKYQTKDAALG